MRLRRSWRLVVFLAVAVGLLAAGMLLPFRAWLDALAAWLAGLGPAGLVLYAAVYAVLTVFMLPVVFLTIAAGYFFGLVPATLTVSIGSTAGSAAAFLIGRYAARARVAEAIARRPRFAAIDRAVRDKGWRIVLLLRLSPLVPFVVSNYLYGATSVPFRHYVLASWVGMLPFTMVYVSLGVAARGATGGVAASAAPPWIVIAAGAAITVVGTVYVRRLVKRAIAEAGV